MTISFFLVQKNAYFEFLNLAGEINCGIPDSDLSTVFTNNGTTENSVAAYTCATGYQSIVGDVSRICQSSGNWSGSAPTCSTNCMFHY